VRGCPIVCIQSIINKNDCGISGSHSGVADDSNLLRGVSDVSENPSTFTFMGHAVPRKRGTA
jgi:hypothetical protein